MKWLQSRIETYYSTTFDELSFKYYADEKALPGMKTVCSSSFKKVEMLSQKEECGHS